METAGGLRDLCFVASGVKTKRAAREPPFRSGWIVLRLSPYHIMSIPPIPPMPPGIAGASFFGSSAIMASVVMSSEATEAAS